MIFMGKRESWRSCVRAKGIVGALPAKLASFAGKRLPADRPERWLKPWRGIRPN